MEQGNSDTDKNARHSGKAPDEHKGRDQGDASTSQGTLKAACKPRGAGREACNRFSLAALGRTNPAHWILDF